MEFVAANAKRYGRRETIVIIMVRLVGANDQSRHKFVGEAVEVAAVELLPGTAAEIALWKGVSSGPRMGV